MPIDCDNAMLLIVALWWVMRHRPGWNTEILQYEEMCTRLLFGDWKFFIGFVGEVAGFSSLVLLFGWRNITY
jgi:hypothetical protein